MGPRVLDRLTESTEWMPCPPRQCKPTNRKARPRQRALYEPFSWVLARAPLLPAETYRALSASPDSLASLLNDPAIRTAIAVGSGSLLDALGRTGSRRPGRSLGQASSVYHSNVHSADALWPFRRRRTGRLGQHDNIIA